MKAKVKAKMKEKYSGALSKDHKNNKDKKGEKGIHTGALPSGSVKVKTRPPAKKRIDAAKRKQKDSIIK